MASKSPAGLTALFEQISGSEALKERFEAAAAEKAAAEEKVRVYECACVYARQQASCGRNVGTSKEGKARGDRNI